MYMFITYIYIFVTDLGLRGNNRCPKWTTEDLKTGKRNAKSFQFIFRTEQRVNFFSCLQ